MLIRRTAGIFRRFRHADKGLAAVEFALLVPVLIPLLFGMGELSLALFARSDITQIASTVADLVAQNSTVTSTDLGNVYNAANTILYPFYNGSTTAGDPKANKATVRITSVIYNTTTSSLTVGKVAWTCSQSGTGVSGTLSPASRKTNDLVTFAAPLLSSGSSVLMVEVAYSYTSPTTKVIAGSYNMTDQFYTKPRRVAQIPAPTSVPPGTNCA